MAPIFEYSSEWNLLAALFIGIAFGWVLERAGFSTSRKLAGVFYGYDFVVIKVFFTAAVTAAVGLLVLNQMGLVYFDDVWMPTTFMAPTIVGGVIMGLGFVLGGFFGFSLVFFVFLLFLSSVFVLVRAYVREG